MKKFMVAGVEKIQGLGLYKLTITNEYYELYLTHACSHLSWNEA